MPFLWLIAVLYTSAWLFDLMNTQSAFNLTIGGLGIVIIIYLTIVTKAGTYIFNLKSKQKQK